MTGGMAMFQSELRSAVRDARDEPAAATSTEPALRTSISGGAQKPPARRHGAPATERRTVVKLWLPLTPLWLLLSPFALLLAPVLAFLPATRGVPPFRAALALGSALIALSGTVVDVDTRDAVVRIRIF